MEDEHSRNVYKSNWIERYTVRQVEMEFACLADLCAWYTPCRAARAAVCIAVGGQDMHHDDGDWNGLGRDQQDLVDPYDMIQEDNNEVPAGAPVG